MIRMFQAETKSDAEYLELPSKGRDVGTHSRSLPQKRSENFIVLNPHTALKMNPTDMPLMHQQSRSIQPRREFDTDFSDHVSSYISADKCERRSAISKASTRFSFQHSAVSHFVNCCIFPTGRPIFIQPRRELYTELSGHLFLYLSTDKGNKRWLECIPECVPPSSEDWNAVSDSTAATVCCFLHVFNNKTEFGSAQTVDALTVHFLGEIWKNFEKSIEDNVVGVDT
ncbi:unnamed protein product [Clavelina lepadiformis]|uniref:Uncharacterized protein n=1 Tax=Clavelina lepadiformis TaxID=159417 RepID=A0ABP0G9Z9_CLALP